MRRAAIAAFGVLTLGLAAPAFAEDHGGLRMRNNPAAMLEQVEANRGCRLSQTTVAMGTNRAFAPGSSSSQVVANGSGGCRPLVTTQVAAGVNLSLGRGSQANQVIAAQGQRGVLATTTFSRGANVAVGARSSASQKIFNQVQ